MRYILATIEKHNGSSQAVNFNDDDATIEHILPQNADESWEMDEEKQLQLVFRLGNTCLLEKKLNMGLKNGSFEEKKKVYALSSYIDAQMIAGYDEWNESKIVNRQSKMAHVAVNIWKI